MVPGLVALVFLPGEAGRLPARALEPVPYSAVRITDGFWAPRIEQNRRVSLRAALSETERAGNLRNFRIAAGWDTGEPTGSQAYDSDVYKILEGIGYSLGVRPDPELESSADRVIGTIAAAQRPDGYLNTHVILAVAERQMADAAH